MAHVIHILNGPNLNLLGQREPEIYGHQSLADIQTHCANHAISVGVELTFRQSNSEGDLVTWVQEARAAGADIIINAAAYTHTSVAIMDALKMCDDVLVIELHLSNPHRRETFRHLSYISYAADAVIAGLGAQGYQIAIDAAVGKRRAVPSA